METVRGEGLHLLLWGEGLGAGGRGRETADGRLTADHCLGGQHCRGAPALRGDRELASWIWTGLW